MKTSKYFFVVILVTYIFSYQALVNVHGIPVNKSTLLALFFIAFNFTMFWLSKINTTCAEVWRYLRMFWIAFAFIFGWNYVKEHWLNKKDK